MRNPPTGVDFVFQDYTKSLFPWRTAAGNVLLGLRGFDISLRDARDRASAALLAVQLSAQSDKFPSELSGGMQQRVAVARSLARRPRLLLLDEPFGSLDPLTKYAVSEQLLHLRSTASKPMSAVIVTHDIEDAIYLGDEILVLSAPPSGGASTIAANITVEVPKSSRLATVSSRRFIDLRRHLHNLLGGS